MKKKTQKEIISQFRTIHGEKYDYTKVKYNGAHSKVCIICPHHGEFFQTPSSHLSGCGCPICRNENNRARFLSTLTNFIYKAQKKHNNKYTYERAEYRGAYEPICITCPIHGSFWQAPHNHLTGNGCPQCGLEKSKTINASTTEEFVRKAQTIHGDKYDYSKTKYVNAFTKVDIICPTHGEFWQTPTKHLSGGGCPKCNGGITITQDEFINKANAIHSNKYDYSKVNYINTSTKVCIICPTHGEFWQAPTNHIHKTRPQGCPKCKSSKMERNVRRFLTENQIQFEEQKRFEWLGKQSLDFYIPSQNIAIECQGEQHFIPIDFFGGVETLMGNVQRDERKYKLCKEHNINLIYYISEEFKDKMKYNNYITNIDYLTNYIIYNININATH
jgi:hypothetical protein